MPRKKTTKKERELDRDDEDQSDKDTTEEQLLSNLTKIRNELQPGNGYRMGQRSDFRPGPITLLKKRIFRRKRRTDK
jgi:hypothetical protein